MVPADSVSVITPACYLSSGRESLSPAHLSAICLSIWYDAPKLSAVVLLGLLVANLRLWFAVESACFLPSEITVGDYTTRALRWQRSFGTRRAISAAV